MFDRLTERLDDVFRQLRGQGRITERLLDESLREIRRALLEADVNFKVAKEFLGRVRERALGQAVMKSLTPGQQVIKIVHDELVSLLGTATATIDLAPQPPTVVLLAGLQGSGKTTIAGKLALHFQKRDRLPYLVAADTTRPAAVDQLRTHGATLGVEVFGPEQAQTQDPVEICRLGVLQARSRNRSIVFLDTAGRNSIDEKMMAQVTRIREVCEPDEVLFVADAMLGQESVETATRFHEALAFDGVILSKMEGDARGGAALSIRQVTGVPVKFIGTGETLEALEPFHPERVASRILGMGDVMSLVEKAENAFDSEQAQRLEAKMRKEAFTFEDFKEQLQAVKRMGPLDQLMGMIPGASKAMKGMQVDDGAFNQTEAIINSMTIIERQRPQILNGSRRRRIARGSGTSIQDVNRLVKQFGAMQKMMRQMSRPGRRGRGRGMPQMPAGFPGA
ncbi:MAG TPA: signal recognition particle protein [Candidatus Latescibacteria bacterium]|nr:signal recognition particle protein [Candidatus Latescibacterota bacterium]